MDEKNINLAITLLLSALSRASEIGQLIAQARSEGRDISDVELDALETEAQDAIDKLGGATVSP